LSSYNIGLAGETVVVDILKANGFQIVRWDTKAPGATDIEANSYNRRLLVQVKSAVYPNEPATLSNSEISSIKSRAAMKNAEAWQVRVQLRSNLGPYRDPEWSQIR
jgi:Holliday junction resolvase